MDVDINQVDEGQITMGAEHTPPGFSVGLVTPDRRGGSVQGVGQRLTCPTMHAHVGFA
jgi:hypothetical protein